VKVTEEKAIFSCALCRFLRKKKKKKKKRKGEGDSLFHTHPHPFSRHGCHTHLTPSHTTKRRKEEMKKRRGRKE